MVNPARNPDAILPPESDEALRTRQRVEAFASWLDDFLRIPGINVRFGWDSILGLIPGVGDLITSVLSFYLITEAMRAGAPQSVVVRMLGNVLTDSVVGAVPVAGDLFDVVYRSNRKNSKLLLDWLERPAYVQRRSKVKVFAVLLGIGLLMIGALVGLVMFISWIFRSLSGSSL